MNRLAQSITLMIMAPACDEVLIKSRVGQGHPFVFGFVVKRTPPCAGMAALILTVPLYGFLQWQFSDIAFLNRMAITFMIIILVMGWLTWIKPVKKPVKMPVNEDYDMRLAPSVLWLGTLVIIFVILFYIIFW